jgi:hypothetical protein
MATRLRNLVLHIRGPEGIGERLADEILHDE